MRKVIVEVVVAVGMFVATGVFAQSVEGNADSENVLAVSGQVRVFAPADRAVVSFEVVGEGKSLAVAFDQARERIDSLQVRLDSIGVPRDALATSFFSSNENEGHKAFLSSKRDYRAAMSATVTTGDLQLLEKIVIVLSESEIERINSISFELIDHERFRREALAKAVSKAKEKAELMCAELDTELGPVVRVEELQVRTVEPDPYSPYRNRSLFNAPMQAFGNADVISEGATAVFSKEIQFDAEVRVMFRLASKEL